LLASALRYAEHYGWYVFPVHWPLLGGGCSCGDPACKDPAKHPLTPHGFKDATTDAVVIAGWWRRWPSANVAVATGSRSNLLVLDFDGPEGLAALADLERQHGPFPPTLRVKTPRGGVHVFFAAPPGEVIRSRTNLHGLRVDVRAEGGYVLVPPSRGVAGPYVKEGVHG
jgi:putative DNA primase/helicase